MKASLLRLADQKVLIPQLEIAESFSSRLKGLLGRHSLPSDQGLWIQRCNSIHTFFMRFEIDCIFLDDQMRVKKVVSKLKPNSLVLPVRGAKTTVELSSGLARELNIQTGDVLHVGR